MNNSNLELIKTLTKSDSKTLSQKALKSVEEIGELAKVILPYDNAFTTTHRFVEKEKILEETVDVMLTVLSIAYELGYDDDQINSMMYQKSLKWMELQNRDKKVSYPIPYEIHVTVKVDKLDEFRHICEVLKVKPIILDLQNTQDDTVVKDVMTSSVFIGDNRTVYDELKRISSGLTSFNFEVVREKIETVPWHPAAPSKDHLNPKMPKNCYFETHYNVVCNDERMKELKLIAENVGAHLSRNIFKKLDNGNFKIMVTYRDYKSTYEEYKMVADNIASLLKDQKFEVDKTITEFSIYDTKVSHDFAWLNK